MDLLSRLLCVVRPCILCSGLLGVAGGVGTRAAIINDGTTTNRLVRLANPESTTFGNTTALRVDDSSTFLVAEQIDAGFIAPFPALRTTWYAGSASAAAATYRVSAEYRPAASIPANQGGVMGWLNTGTSNGIVLKVVPASGGETLPFSFQLTHVDFTGTTPGANENLETLYNLDGNPATNSFDSAWSDPTNYVAEEFALFEIDFSLPTAEDFQAVSNATARVTAKVYQGSVAGTPTQVGRSIEMLTTLPVPPPASHRFGYFGVWSSFFAGDLIGDYRHLTAEGEIQLNLAPTVVLAQPAPGTTLTAPATFMLEANATDPDGSIVGVEFFEGTNSLGRVTSSPFVWSWSGVMEGSYVITAVATDNLGESTVSEPVAVTVLPGSGTTPVLSAQVTGETIHLAWTGTGFQLQYKTALGDLEWNDVPGTTGVSQIDLPTNLGAQYFRLVGSGTPTGPQLSISMVGNSLTISWPGGTTGYRLQSKNALDDSPWTDIPTTGNTYSESISGGTRFYRLAQ